MATESKPDEAAPPAKQYRFGLKWLLAVVLMFAVVFAWLGRESRRVRREIRLSGELAQLEVRITSREPTGLDLAAHKLLGRNDEWLRKRLHVSWFGRPREVTTWAATDEQIPQIAQRIKQLRTVRELHVIGAPTSEAGIARLKSELPHVAVLTRADLDTAAYREPKTYFAAAAVEFVAISAAAVLAVVVVLVWPLVRWGLDRRRTRDSAPGN